MANGTIPHTSDVYSTSEVLTDKVWIDGKPIYRTVVTVNSLASGSQMVATGITSISSLTLLYGIAVVGSNIIPIPYNYPNVDCGVLLNIPLMKLQVVMGFDSNEAYFIIEYTK